MDVDDQQARKVALELATAVARARAEDGGWAVNLAGRFHRFLTGNDDASARTLARELAANHPDELIDGLEDEWGYAGLVRMVREHGIRQGYTLEAPDDPDEHVPAVRGRVTNPTSTGDTVQIDLTFRPDWLRPLALVEVRLIELAAGPLPGDPVTARADEDCDAVARATIGELRESIAGELGLHFPDLAPERRDHIAASTALRIRRDRDDDHEPF